MNLLRWSGAPADATLTQKRNFLRAHVDAIGMGLAMGAGPFLPVFLARLGATTFQVGLLTAMPGLAGLLLAVVIGRFLQSRRNIVPWFSRARLINVSAYTLTGLVPFVLPNEHVVPAVLVIWAVVTVTQTLGNVSFQVVMSAVAGPKGRYALMSRRWSLLGLVKAVTLAIVGYALDRTGFPTNYQLVFVGLSLGGLLSYSASSRYELPAVAPSPRADKLSLRRRLKESANLILERRAFISVAVKRFVYSLGTFLLTPLLPLYYVREVEASDAWIGIIATTQTAVTLVGFYLWARQSSKRGSRFVLLCTTCGLALYPVLVAFTLRVELIVLYAGLAGIFQAGLSLVLFDELMKTVPPEHSPLFVSVALSLQYLSTAAAPMMGTFLADQIGLSGALLVGAGLRIVGFGLFALGKEGRQAAQG